MAGNKSSEQKATFRHKVGGCCMILVALVAITITVAFLVFCGYQVGRVDQQDTSIGASFQTTAEPHQPKAITPDQHDDSITTLVLTNTTVVSTPHGYIIITVNP